MIWPAQGVPVSQIRLLRINTLIAFYLIWAAESGLGPGYPSVRLGSQKGPTGRAGAPVGCPGPTPCLSVPFCAALFAPGMSGRGNCRPLCF